jgi:hypothetical protein
MSREANPKARPTSGRREIGNIAIPTSRAAAADAVGGVGDEAAARNLAHRRKIANYLRIVIRKSH